MVGIMMVCYPREGSRNKKRIDVKMRAILKIT
jgi:hypothetical protein